MQIFFSFSMPIEEYKIKFTTLTQLTNQRQHVFLMELKEPGCSIYLRSTQIKALVLRGAYFFDIIISYCFHTGSSMVCCCPGRT